MAASWSSAATGKPQLSYAERLRRAKEGSLNPSQKTDIARKSKDNNKETESLSRNEVLPSWDVDKEASSSTPKREQQQKESTLTTNTLNHGGIKSPLVNVPLPLPSAAALKLTSDDTSTAPFTVDVERAAQMKSPVNVWDARKRMLQEREKAKEEQRKELPSTVAGSSQATSQTGKDNSKMINKSTVQERGKGVKSPQPIEDTKGRTKTQRNEAIQGDVWLQKIHMLNGGMGLDDVGVGEKDVQQTSKASIDNGVSDKIHNSRDPPKMMSILQSGTQEEETKVKTNKKKKGGEAVPTKATSNISLPSITDATAWPSPDVSLSAASRSNSEASRRQDEEQTEERSARQLSASSASKGLEGLDVEIVKRAGAETQRRGKQWIPIVPTITHTSPLPGTQTRKKPGKEQPFTLSNGSNSFSASRRSEQKRPSPLLMQNASLSDKNVTTSTSTLPSPQIGDRSLSLSPLQHSKMMSPGLTKVAQFDESLQKRSSSVTPSPRRELSSSPLRSPSLKEGSIRGPRFTGEAIKSPKQGAEWHRSLSTDRNTSQHNVSLQQDIASDDVSTRLSNALHLSDPLDMTSASSVQSSLQDNSYPTSRASSSTTFAVGSGNQNSSWRASPVNGGNNGALSPRGSRGRGKISKAGEGHSVGDSDSSKNDIEERGLPSDVPSGPRLRNEGGRGGYRRGAYHGHGYAGHPMPFGGNAMYRPPPPGYYYPPPLPVGPLPSTLESTPTEFAPIGDASKSEPSQALLHQMEFYFSHRNLEGDFYLRKNMDSQGYVPIEFVANFKKVKNMTDKIDVIKETLFFSRVLQIDTERNLVRRAIDWHLYPLIDGERPQQNVYQFYGPRQQQAPFTAPPFGPIPPPPTSMSYYGQQPQPMYYPHPPPPPSFSQPHPYFQNGSYSNGSYSNENQSWSQHQSIQRMGDFAEGNQSNEHSSGDNDEDEVLGVVAAEGLAGAPKV